MLFRSESRCRTRVDISTTFDQGIHYRCMSFRGRPHQGSLIVSAIFRIYLCRVREQRIYRSNLPVRAAVISAVSPPGKTVLGSEPAFSSASIISALPFTQASDRGVTP